MRLLPDRTRTGAHSDLRRMLEGLWAPCDDPRLVELKRIRFLHRSRKRRLSVCLMMDQTNCIQSVLCAKVHSLQQRLCRWLLTLHDRTGSSKLYVTQQFLSELLNTSRPLLTATAGVLSNA